MTKLKVQGPDRLFERGILSLLRRLVIGILFGFGIWSLGFAAGAASPGAKAAKEALANLRKLRSFEFTQSMLSRELPEIKGEFAGAVFQPDTEAYGGFWQGPDGKVPTQTRARGEVEYTLEDSAWTIHARSPETGFLAQLERALAFDSFRAPAKKGKYFEVGFVPNLQFLNPMGTKRLSATIRVRRDRMLPEEITARSADDSVFWQVKLSNFDHAEPIAFPFVRQWCVSLTPDPRPPTPDFKDTLTLRERFRGAGYETQFEPGPGSLQVFLEQEIRDDLLKTLITPGRLMLGLGRLADARQPAPIGFRKVALAGDTTKAAIIERTVLDPSGWTAITLTESLAEPLLELSLTKKGQAKLAELAQLENSGSNWALLLDDRVVACGSVEHRSNPARLRLSASGSRLFLKQVGNIFRSGPLGSLYRLSDVSQVSKH
jgi:hypothetical protein